MEPKEFTAPTFIVIRAESTHEIVALEDGILVEMCEEYSEYDTVRITI